MDAKFKLCLFWPFRRFCHLISELFYSDTLINMPKETIASLKQQDQSLKQQVDALYKEVKSLKETFAATEAVNESNSH